eukprot:2160443-Rhodomonas_salina.1
MRPIGTDGGRRRTAGVVRGEPRAEGRGVRRRTRGRGPGTTAHPIERLCAYAADTRGFVLRMGCAVLWRPSLCDAWCGI